jgi:hypothetical protein
MDFQHVTPIAKEKPLEKVFQKWLYWNYSNTLIIDHNACRVGCYLPINIIIPAPFYVRQLQRIEDDKMYLKSSFWPLLQEVFGCLDVTKYILHVSSNITEVGLKNTKST